MIAIRPERAQDSAAVDRIIREAFGQPDEAALVDRLRADGDAEIALVALEDGAVVGHVMLSPMTAPFRALGHAPLAVAPGRQRQGVGAALVEASIAAARADGWSAIFVLGDPAYYRRFGFSAEAAQGFASPYAGPYLQVLALQHRLPGNSGSIDYAPAFAGLG
jgi:putative acetyltransferase